MQNYATYIPIFKGKSLFYHTLQLPFLGISAGGVPFSSSEDESNLFFDAIDRFLVTLIGESRESSSFLLDSLKGEFGTIGLNENKLLVSMWGHNFKRRIFNFQSFAILDILREIFNVNCLRKL